MIDRAISKGLVDLGYSLREFRPGREPLEIVSSDGKTLYKISGDFNQPVFEAYALLPEGVVYPSLTLPPGEVELALKNLLGQGAILGGDAAEDKLMMIELAQSQQQGGGFDAASDSAHDSPMLEMRQPEAARAVREASVAVQSHADQQKVVEAPKFTDPQSFLSAHARDVGWEGDGRQGELATQYKTAQYGANLLNPPRLPFELKELGGNQTALAADFLKGNVYPRVADDGEFYLVDTSLQPLSEKEKSRMKHYGADMQNLEARQRGLGPELKDPWHEDKELIAEVLATGGPTPDIHKPTTDEKALAIGKSPERLAILEQALPPGPAGSPSEHGGGSAAIPSRMKLSEEEREQAVRQKSLSTIEDLAAHPRILLGTDPKHPGEVDVFVQQGNALVFVKRVPEDWSQEDNPLSVEQLLALPPKASADVTQPGLGPDMMANLKADPTYGGDNASKVESYQYTLSEAGSAAAAVPEAPAAAAAAPPSEAEQIGEDVAGMAITPETRTVKRWRLTTEPGRKVAGLTEDPTVPRLARVDVEKPLKTKTATSNVPREIGLSDAAQMGILFGSLAALDVGMELAATQGSARKEGRKRIETLEEKRRKGTLGRDKSLEAAERRELVDPIKAYASEARKRGEAQLAATGGTLSAGELARRRQEEQSTVASALGEAAKRTAATRRQRADQELRELQSLYEYQQQNLEGAMGRVSDIASAGAMQYGKMKASEAQYKPEMIDMVGILLERNPNMTTAEAMTEAEKMYQTMGR